MLTRKDHIWAKIIVEGVGDMVFVQQEAMETPRIWLVVNLLELFCILVDYVVREVKPGCDDNCLLRLSSAQAKCRKLEFRNLPLQKLAVKLSTNHVEAGNSCARLVQPNWLCSWLVW